MAEPGVRLAVLSLQRQCPGATTWLFLPEPSMEFRRWLAQFPAVEVRMPVAQAEAGWNCKPAALLAMLDAGFDEVIWLDADLIVLGDIRGELTRWGPEVLVTTEECDGAPHPGTMWRARAWGLAPGREYGCAINSCVVRVTVQHRGLLEEWRRLLRREDYRAAQRLPGRERKTHFNTDQDALGALLGSKSWAALPVQLLRSGADVVHHGVFEGFGLRERWARWRGGRVLLVHSIVAKPWQRVADGRVNLGMLFFTTLAEDLSTYSCYARRLKAEAGIVGDCFELRLPRLARWAGLGFGHDALRGWPYVLVRRALRAGGFNWIAARCGVAARA